MAVVTFSLLARKGGVGRTTTTLNLAGVWAKEGAKVLIFDMDSQASMSRCLLGSDVVESRHPAETVAGLFDPQFDPEPDEVICPTKFDNLFVVPACDRLEDFNNTKPEDSGDKQYALGQLIHEVKNDFDCALIDTGPNTCGLTAWASLAASHYVISPTICDAFGTQSIISVQRLVEKIQTSVNPHIEILGYFVNMRQKNKLMDAYEETLRKIHGSMIFRTSIQFAAAYRQSVSERTPLALKKGRGNKATHTLCELAAEIDARVCALLDKGGCLMPSFKDRFADNIGEDIGLRPEGHMAAESSQVVGRSRMRNAASIDVSCIDVDAQHREEFDEESIERLARSLTDHGQLQPIRVRWDEARERYVLIAGERRLRAMQRAGFEKADCVIAEGTLSDSEILTQQIIENCQREDLRPVERAHAFRDLMETNSWDGKRLAAELHVSEGTVSNALKLLGLDEETQAKVDAGDLKATVAVSNARRSRKPKKKKAPKPRVYRTKAGRVVCEPKVNRTYVDALEIALHAARGEAEQRREAA